MYYLDPIVLTAQTTETHNEFKHKTHFDYKHGQRL